MRQYKPPTPPGNVKDLGLPACQHATLNIQNLNGQLYEMYEQPFVCLRANSVTAAPQIQKVWTRSGRTLWSLEAPCGPSGHAWKLAHAQFLQPEPWARGLAPPFVCLWVTARIRSAKQQARLSFLILLLRCEKKSPLQFLDRIPGPSNATGGLHHLFLPSGEFRHCRTSKSRRCQPILWAHLFVCLRANFVIAVPHIQKM